LAFVEHIRERLGPGPPGEVWAGDDAAVLPSPGGPVLLTADTLVEGVHFDLSLSGVDDLGWKALAVSVSDIAAMGGRPLHALVTVTVPRGRGGDLEQLYDGLEAAARAFACPVVGGDLTSGPHLSVTVAVMGTAPKPVLRSQAKPDDALLVTGPLGGGAAGLRLLRGGAVTFDPADLRQPEARAALAHRRPEPRVAEGDAARRAGASAMIDLSDGLALDLRRLADASGVGVVVDQVPLGPAASLDEALTGGDDYELLFAVPDARRAHQRFEEAGLSPPFVIGRCTNDPGERRLGAGPLPEGGWEHTW